MKTMLDAWKFIRELKKLEEKTGFYVGGCGCGGSPYLMDTDANKQQMNYEDTLHDLPSDLHNITLEGAEVEIRKLDPDVTLPHCVS